MGQDVVQNKMGGAKDFIAERKENRAMLGQQVINNGFGANNGNAGLAKVRHASAKKRPPVAMTPAVQNQGRNTQGGWANG